VRSLAITFLVGGLLMNVGKPLLFLLLSSPQNKHKDNYTWAKSWVTLIVTFYIIVINVQQLLILLFYYRLDQKKDRKNINRYSM